MMHKFNKNRASIGEKSIENRQTSSINRGQVALGGSGGALGARGVKNESKCAPLCILVTFFEGGWELKSNQNGTKGTFWRSLWTLWWSFGGFFDKIVEKS